MTEHAPDRHDGEPQGEPPGCLACSGEDWREFSRLGSLYDRVLWMDRHVPDRGAPSRADLITLPSTRHPRDVPA